MNEPDEIVRGQGREMNEICGGWIHPAPSGMGGAEAQWVKEKRKRNEHLG